MCHVFIAISNNILCLVRQQNIMCFKSCRIAYWNIGLNIGSSVLGNIMEAFVVSIIGEHGAGRIVFILEVWIKYRSYANIIRFKIIHGYQTSPHDCRTNRVRIIYGYILFSQYDLIGAFRRSVIAMIVMIGLRIYAIDWLSQNFGSSFWKNAHDSDKYKYE